MNRSYNVSSFSLFHEVVLSHSFLLVLRQTPLSDSKQQQSACVTTQRLSKKRRSPTIVSAGADVTQSGRKESGWFDPTLLTSRQSPVKSTNLSQPTKASSKCQPHAHRDASQPTTSPEGDETDSLYSVLWKKNATQHHNGRTFHARTEHAVGPNVSKSYWKRE